MKKKYSLALWWGAAIWLLHIWVIKVIEEKKINITEVSWTSMWAIIAALFALWKTSDEMEKFAKEINFMKLLDFDMKNWLLKWNKISKKLEDFFWDTNIEDLPIKLKIIATNIETGWKKVFETWKIIDAIRSSISLPWIFIPNKIWDFSYIDWWILSNLPIEVLDWKNIIAVSAIKKIVWPINVRKKIMWFDYKVWFLNLNFQILQRSLLLMMKSNEEKSISTKWKKITLISPNTNPFDFYSFNKVDELMEVWYNEANKIL
jgi:predicted acylesterase/phospholipase RssA